MAKHHDHQHDGHDHPYHSSDGHEIPIIMSEPVRYLCGCLQIYQTLSTETGLLQFCLSQNLLKMHVAPGNRDLLPFWVFFGLRSSGSGRPGD